MPLWALILVYWLHMLATVTWLGTLVALSLIVLPASSKVLDIDGQSALLDAIQQKLDALSWFCLFLLVATGMFQLSANPNYHGLLSMQNTWEKSILAKHALVLLMAVASMFMSWGVLPAIRRAKIRLKRTGEAAEMESLRRRERLLLRVNLILAALVLLATAAARGSY